MKQRDLILGLGILSAFGMSAADSPFTGAVLSNTDTATYYLYQVETGQWLQNNRRNPVAWTTRGELDRDGMDIEVRPLADGTYELYTNLTGNGLVRPGDHYMDTGDASTWSIFPAENDVTNGYYIQSAIRGGSAYDPTYLMGAVDEEAYLGQTDESGDATWQFVTREERIQWMLAHPGSDATWLIPHNDMGRNDKRDRTWKHYAVGGGNNNGHDGLTRNAVRECWSNATNYAHYVVLTDIPNGTYKFRLQAYYRDGGEGTEDFQQRLVDGQEILRAKYFANASEGTVMPISAIGSEEDFGDFGTPESGDGSQKRDFKSTYIEAAGIYIPNSCCTAAGIFLDPDAHQNEWIETVVTDGTLAVGLIKDEGADGDWLVFDNFQLQYVSDATPATDVTALQAKINELIAEAETMPQTPGLSRLLAEAKEIAKGSSAAKLRDYFFQLRNTMPGIREAKGAIETYQACAALAPANNKWTAKAEGLYNDAVTAADFNYAAKWMRFARRRANAHRDFAEFKGCPAPTETGDYYLYNVGQQQFLQGGSDWGAHASLGMPGIELTLELENYDQLTYHFNTHLNNGGDKNYMNYRGYMDCDKGAPFQLIPVEGEENVYNIIQFDWKDAYVVFYPGCDTDGGKDQECEMSVSTEARNVYGKAITPDMKDAQWKLVTRAQRDEILAAATKDAPVDATYRINNPGFNQRQDISAWTIGDGTGVAINGRGNRYHDFTAESWDTEAFACIQTLEDMPVGTYALYVNGFHRAGDHPVCADGERDHHSYLFFGYNDIVELPNILDYADQAPGEGAVITAADGTQYRIPQYCNQAADMFRSGLYQVHMAINYDGSEAFEIGVGKDEKKQEKEWTVFDNFRLMYFGPNATEEDVENYVDGIESIEGDAADFRGDNRTYNLQGIEVANPSAPGIYIRNGRKFVVK